MRFCKNIDLYFLKLETYKNNDLVLQSQHEFKSDSLFFIVISLNINKKHKKNSCCYAFVQVDVEISILTINCFAKWLIEFSKTIDKIHSTIRFIASRHHFASSFHQVFLDDEAITMTKVSWLIFDNCSKKYSDKIKINKSL